MSKRQLLFVTYRDANVLGEGISYAIELAKAMQEDIVFLLAPRKKTLFRTLENMMAGVAFAEQGEHETAREISEPASGKVLMKYREKITELMHKCSKAGVHLDLRETGLDIISGIRNFVSLNPGIDKVVLSPSVTESEVLSTRDLNRLVRTASRPIVTMTKQSVWAMREKKRSEKESSVRYEPSVSY